MATQLAEPAANPVETGQDTDPQARDYEAEARAHNWRPLEEFPGDPSRWVDAETFIKRADEIMPLLKKQNETLKRELQDVKKSARRMEEHFTKAEERIRAEIMEKMEQAVEVGDVAGFRKLQGEAEALGEKKQIATMEEATEAFDGFRDENPWYDRANLKSASETDTSARIYADRMMEKHVAKTRSMPPAEFFSFIEGLVAEKYPQIKTRTARPKGVSEVAGVTNRAPRAAGKTFADLPAEAQRACDKWVKQGLIKDRAAYVASYDFGGSN